MPTESSAEAAFRHAPDSYSTIAVVVIVAILLLIIGGLLIYNCLSEAFFSPVEGGNDKNLTPDRGFRETIVGRFRKNPSVAPQKDAEKGVGTTKARIERKGTMGCQWLKLFKQYDKSKTGRLPVSTFKTFLGDKAAELNLKPDQVAQIAKEADIDGDGYVDFEEFAETMMAHRHRKYTRGLSMKMSRLVMSTRQRTDAARDALDYSCCPPPTFLIAIALMEIGVYYYQVDLCGYQNMCVYDKLFAIDPRHPFQIWRYLTFMLVHFSPMHLVGNVISQFVFGTTLELAHRWRIAAVFLLGSISSGLFSAAIDSTTSLYLGGASGGVFALVAAHCANVTLNWKEMNRPFIHLFLSFCFVAYNILQMLSESAAGTSYSGHVGGFIGGLLLGLLFLRNVVQEKWEAKVRKTALSIYLLLISFCIGAICLRALGPNPKRV